MTMKFVLRKGWKNRQVVCIPLPVWTWLYLPLKWLDFFLHITVFQRYDFSPFYWEIQAKKSVKNWDVCFRNYISVSFINSRPPEPFSAKRHSKRRLLQPLTGFSIFNALYPYIYYQCIAMFLLLQLIPQKYQKYHPSSFEVTMAL